MCGSCGCVNIGRNGGIEAFGGQKFEKLRKRSLETGAPWRDPEFPASQASLGPGLISKLPPKIRWLRPTVSHDLDLSRKFQPDPFFRNCVRILGLSLMASADTM